MYAIGDNPDIRFSQLISLTSIHIVEYLLKARIVESQQLANTRQQPINNNRGIVFSLQSVPMAANAIAK
jgi:hypothetical protein